MASSDRLDRREFIVAAGATSLALASPWPGRSAAAAPGLELGEFRDPAPRYRPWLYWWWPGGAVDGRELSREIAEMADAGFGGATMTWLDLGVADPDDPAVASWGTPSWRARVAEALDAARDHKLRLDFTSASAWAFNSPATTPANGLSSRELVYGKYEVTGPARLEIDPPAPPGDAASQAGDDGEATLIAVTVARLAEPASTAKPRLLTADTVEDLTKRIGADGRVRWDVPAGTWLVFGHWHRPTRQQPWLLVDTSAEPTFVIDHFEKRSVLAATGYLDEHVLTGPVAPLLQDGAGSIYLDSLEIDTEGALWTPDFLREFERRRGYSLVSFLPAVLFIPGQSFRAGTPKAVPDVDFSDGSGERVRHDYCQTLTDLYLDDQLRPITAWARTHGMSVRAQPAYGTTLDPVRSATTLPQLETETLAHLQPAPAGSPEFRYGMDAYRMTTSGAHIGAANEIGLELGAVFLADFTLTFSQVKAMIDQAYACGVNQAVLHGYPYRIAPGSAWPSWHPFSTELLPFGFSEIWSGVQPQWRHMGDLTGYIARNNMALQFGTPRVDLAIYHDGFLLRSHDAPVFDGAALQDLGFTYGFLDPVSLAERRDAGGGRVLFPRGPAYRALVIDDEPAMPAEAAERVLSLARSGLPVVVVGDPPRRGTSLRRAADEDRRVRRAFGQLAQEPTVRLVGAVTDVAGALDEKRVAPRLRFAVPAPVYAAQRRGDDASIYYLWNPGPDGVQLEVSFEENARPAVLDAWSGEVRQVAQYRRRAGRTELSVALRAGETMLVHFDQRQRDRRRHVVATTAGVPRYAGDRLVVRYERPATAAVAFSDGSSRTVDLPPLPQYLHIDQWHLRVEGVGPDATTVTEFDLDQLRDWREIPEIRDWSGVGTYRATVRLDRGWRRAAGAYLDLGTVHGSVRVSVNGRSVGHRAVADAPVEIEGRFLRAGNLTIEVEVATTLRNRLLHLARSGDPRYARFLAREASGSGSQPAGLLGPARLSPFGAVPV